jgi:hypothetical protein
MTTTESARDARIRTLTAQGWSPELFAEFWAAPDPKYLAPMCAPDIVGHWPGADEPVRGASAYIGALIDLLALLPDVRLEVPAHAVNGDTGFVRWVMHATGANGPFQLDGVDCVRTRDGLVVENHINFDGARFRALVGTPA